MSEVVILFMTYSERQCAEFMTQLVQPDAQLISPPVSPYVPFTKPSWRPCGKMGVNVWVFNATFYNISVMSALLVKETGVTGENHQSVASP